MRFVSKLWAEITATVVLAAAAAPAAYSQVGPQTRAALPPLSSAVTASASAGVGRGAAVTASVGTQVPPVSRTGGAAPARENTVVTGSFTAGIERPLADLKAQYDKPAASAPAFDYQGTYAIDGVSADGTTKYAGTATISRIGGNMFSVSTHVGSTVFHEVAIVDVGGAMSGAWSATNHGVNVVSYDVLRNGAWDGVWFGSANTTLGREVAVPVSGSTAHLTVTGADPGGQSYGGMLAATPASPGANIAPFTAYALQWNIGGALSDGMALRVGNLVAAAFPAVRQSPYGVMVRVPVAATKQFRVQWLQNVGGALTSGTETWTYRR